LALYRRTLHPDLDGFGAVGLFFAQGPYFPLLELQARWIAAIWAGDVAPPDRDAMRRAVAEPAPVDLHHVFAAVLADELGCAPNLLARPDLTEPLVFGPLLPPRYRFDGPGAHSDAPALFAEQLAASPRAPVDPVDVASLRGFGLGDVADALERAGAPRPMT
jgi:dimethylaniline monooxygenase (N-oxide forming)